MYNHICALSDSEEEEDDPSDDDELHTVSTMYDVLTVTHTHHAIV